VYKSVTLDAGEQLSPPRA